MNRPSFGSQIGRPALQSKIPSHGLGAFRSTAAACLFLALASSISAQTVTELEGDHLIKAAGTEDGDLTIEGNLHIDSNFDFGSTTEEEPAESQAAVSFYYGESTTPEVRISATRDSTSFLWEQNHGVEAETKMKLAGDNVLSLYNATSGTETITLNPNTGKITLGTGGGIVLPNGAGIYNANGTPKLTVDTNGNLSFSGEATFNQAIKANGGVQFAPGVELNDNNASYLQQTLQNLGYSEETPEEDTAYILPSNISIWSMARDSSGNIYLAGSLFGSTKVGSYSLAGNLGLSVMVILKLNSSGVVQWAHQVSGYDEIWATSVAVDSSGNAYVTSVSYSATLEGLPEPLAGGVGIIKYSTTGSVTWAKNLGEAGAINATGIAVDGSGNAYITGDFSGTLSTGVPQSIASVGASDAYIVKLNSSGTAQWAKRFGGTGGDYSASISADSSGNTYIAGRFEGSLNNGLPVTLVSEGGTDVFLAKFNTSGTAQWGKSFGGTTDDLGMKVALDSSGSAYVGGEFRGTTSGLTPQLVSAGAGDIFLAKFSDAGVVQNAVRFGGSSGDALSAMAIDGATDSICLTGSFAGTINYGGSAALVATGSTDQFLTQFDSSGTVEWAESFGGTSGVGIQGILSHNSSIILAGQASPNVVSV